MLTNLGWVSLDGKADKRQTNFLLNHVKTEWLQKLVQKFGGNTELCNILQKQHQVTSKKGSPCNENTENYHIESLE